MELNMKDEIFLGLVKYYLTMPTLSVTTYINSFVLGINIIQLFLTICKNNGTYIHFSNNAVGWFVQITGFIALFAFAAVIGFIVLNIIMLILTIIKRKMEHPKND